MKGEKVKSFRRKLFFTLVELLVVISIIAILASMLLPSLISAKKAVMRIDCAKNLKEIGICNEMYTSDYQGWLPPMSLPARTGIGWRLLLSEYVGYRTTEPRRGSIFVCPVVPDWIFYDTTYQGSAGHYLTGYGYNAYLNTTILKISNINNPSKFILYGDTYDQEAGNIGYASKYLYGHQATTLIGNRHNSGINVSWADGHAEWHKRGELMNHSDWYNP